MKWLSSTSRKLQAKSMLQMILEQKSYIFCRAKYKQNVTLFISGITKFIFLPIIFLLSLSNAEAQENLDYGVHANIIYHFTKYIDWPRSKKTGDFIIGIIGDSPLYDELQKLAATKTVGNREIIIKKFSSSETNFNCHILFISEDKRKSLKKIVAATINTSTLIVSESEGLASKGSCINFVIVRERLKLEINKNNIEERNLGIATELLSLGIIAK